MRPAFYVLLGVLLVPTVGLVGDVVTDGKFTSTMPTGAPLEVASDDMVANLNADMVDGVEGTDIYTKAEVNALVAAASGSRRFYLSVYWVGPTGAPSTCADGYHFASIWELALESNLQYAYDHPEADSFPDSGNGAPVGMTGWVRTGWASSHADEPGQANCDTWTSVVAGAYGTVAGPASKLSDPTWGGQFIQVPGTPWMAAAQDCSATASVWCIEDY